MTTPPVLRLVDISNNNAGPIDWHAVAASGVAGVILKRSEGLHFVDATFPGYWEAARAAGLLCGCYHFAHPDTNPPELEAHAFLSLLPELAPGDLVALDLEVGSGNQAAWALAWLGVVEAAVGFPPLLYSYQSYIQQALGDARLARYPLWLANYGPACPPSLGIWQEIALWQHTERATVPGIPGLVDESLIARDLAGLRALGKPPVPRTIAVACALKPDASHRSAALAMLSAGTHVQVTGAPLRTDDTWLPVRVGSRSGYVPSSKLA